MELQTMLQKLNERLSDAEIARRISERGVTVSQSTITRVRNGAHSTSYEVGKVIEALFGEFESEFCE